MEPVLPIKIMGILILKEVTYIPLKVTESFLLELLSAFLCFVAWIRGKLINPPDLYRAKLRNIYVD